LSEGEFKKRIRLFLAANTPNGYLEGYGLHHVTDLDKMLDEARKEFGEVWLVQSLGKRNDPDEGHFQVDKKYWKQVLEKKKDGKHGEAWFEFEDPDKAVKAFLKWFSSPSPFSVKVYYPKGENKCLK
jgi:hypothetical protein